ncbi:MAG TPA: hypothetical protein VGJ20_38280 [Xanthobacteraceae bacterium]
MVVSQHRFQHGQRKAGCLCLIDAKALPVAFCPLVVLAADLRTGAAARPEIGQPLAIVDTRTFWTTRSKAKDLGYGFSRVLAHCILVFDDVRRNTPMHTRIKHILIARQCLR